MTDSLTGSCVFCGIAAGAIPAEIVASTELSVAFRDLDPKAPLHVLVIPRAHANDVGALAATDPVALADLVELASRVAEDDVAGEYRLVFNTGRAAGQSVFHVHGHVLGGRSLAWPPG